jgi:endoglucanase
MGKIMYVAFKTHIKGDYCPVKHTSKQVFLRIASILIALGLITSLLPFTGLQQVEAQSSSGYLRTSGNKIVNSSGAVVAFSGVNWFGFETANYAPHGLWSRNMEQMLDQIKSKGYNSIRLPFANAMLSSGVMPNGIDYSKNPNLQGLTALQVMDKFIEAAGARGIRVILDNHRSSPGGGPEGGGLWYTSEYPESRWIDDWRMLATRYKGNPTVVGMDLRNEPHGACWGCGNTATDWRLAAERAGNAILAINPDLLIIVEGVAAYNNNHYWWGGNLMGAKQHPVRLNVANRLVYSPHDYPETVYPQPWFNDPNYPNNLPAIWEQYWGYLHTENIAPILIGEFGTYYQSTKDRQWLQTLASYIKGRGMSWTYWCLNPNSGDTGGLLLDDWVTWHDGKQSVLAGIQYPFIDSGSSPAPAPTATRISPTSTPTSAPVQPTNTPTKAPVQPTSTPTKAPVQPTSTPTQAPASTLVLANFENGKVSNFGDFKDWNSSISRRAVKPGMFDKYAMEVTYRIADHGWAGVHRTYSQVQNWTTYTHFNFGFRGTASGNWIRLEILDNRSNNNLDTAERFEYIFKDDFTGWRQFKIPFTSFNRRGDWQPDGAPNDGFNRTVWGFNISPLHGQGSFQVDQFEVSR